MSDYVLPNLPGIRVDREPEDRTSTTVYKAPTGAEQRVSRQIAPLRRFHITYGHLSDDMAAPSPWNPYSEVGALRWFFRTHLGAKDSFLWDDPDARKNLLAYSQDFSQATWAKAGITVTPDAAVAPDGTTTADQLASTVADGNVSGGFTPSVITHTVGLWLRAAAPLTVNLYLVRASPFAVITGPIAASVVSAWTRFTLSGTPLDLSQHNLQIGGGNTLGIGATIFAWGAQAEPASVAGLYVPTTASPFAGRYRVRFEADSFRLHRLARYIWEASFDLVEVLS